MGEEKLVRDRIPELIRLSGNTPNIRVVSANELDFFLRTKIVEEAEELLESGEIEEVVDILEVIEALIMHRQLKRSDITAQQTEKRGQRGGFEKGFILTIDE
ncbi:MAG: nucleoside triphosphate pyrophosphohydrolase [Candidatus Thorarchaeota archaeon]